MLKSNRKKEYNVNLHRTYLKNKREALGKTVIDLADLIGISTDYYSQLENGFRGKRLSVKMLIRIAKSLDMNLCEAIKGERDFIKKKEEMTLSNKRNLDG